ncbi:VOC family protein [Streptomyces sp. NPDC058457]|uniref:VOC family protein n=1 Tax=Streptomyces sp. NPDC058457 TaxID=3346507 RepID=UPI00364D76ED
MHARLDHVGVNVRDLPAQLAWYRTVFGLKTVFEFHLDGPGLTGVVLEHPHGWRLELLARPGSVPGLRAPDPMAAALTEGYGHFAVTTPELAPVYTALVAHGASEVLAPGPSPEPGVRMAWVKDPEGNLIELIERGGLGEHGELAEGEERGTTVDP